MSSNRPVKIRADIARDGLWFVVQVGANGETEMFSETYSGRTSNESRGKAIRAAKRIAGRIANAVVDVWNVETQTWDRVDG